MTFVSGQYALRGAPFTGIGGMYATGNGVDKVVTTAAEVPSTVDAQIASMYLGSLRVFSMIKTNCAGLPLVGCYSR